MILSASRRTDIPSCYSDWFFNRLKAGFVLVRNPRNQRQVRRIRLTPEVVDGMVFWTKNPLPMLDRLAELADYACYFQFTVTPYGQEIEPAIPAKDVVLTAFRRLSAMLGADRVIWRYDPILISERYSPEYHIRAFGQMAEALHGYTRRVTISFLDENYRGVQANRKELALSEFPVQAQLELGAALADIARHYGLTIDACAEELALQQFGIEEGRCIDDRLLEKLLGLPLRVGKDKTQRPGCGCASAVDIGMYNTCRNGCRYCYANYSPHSVAGNAMRHNPFSPLISGELRGDERIYEREGKSCRDVQLCLGNL